jgi:hypothetical protein
VFCFYADGDSVDLKLQDGISGSFAAANVYIEVFLVMLLCSIVVFFIWFVRLLTLRPLLAYYASLG